MGNVNLNSARVSKDNEFYTQLGDIEAELLYYRGHFCDKTIYCNCDDPATSNFWRYFHVNFAKLGLRGLVATYYDFGRPVYKFSYFGGDDLNVFSGFREDLTGDGDFRSEECRRILQECDVVVTNPPFGLMSEYLPMLIDSGLGFVVLGTLNHVTLRSIKPSVLSMKCWLGSHRGQMHMWFRVPDSHEFHATDYREDSDGSKWRRIGSVCWFTNLDISVRHEPLLLTRAYSSEVYPKYDDYDAIECGRVVDIPDDYFGVIGVPVTYLAWHCHEQFEILDLVTPRIAGKLKYKRLLIKRR